MRYAKPPPSRFVIVARSYANRANKHVICHCLSKPGEWSLIWMAETCNYASVRLETTSLTWTRSKISLTRHTPRQVTVSTPLKHQSFLKFTNSVNNTYIACLTDIYQLRNDIFCAFQHQCFNVSCPISLDYYPVISHKKACRHTQDERPEACWGGEVNKRKVTRGQGLQHRPPFDTWCVSEVWQNHPLSETRQHIWRLTVVVIDEQRPVTSRSAARKTS